jgi:hypothetical protein
MIKALSTERRRSSPSKTYDGGSGTNDADTRDYMYKAMRTLLETYPDLDGFGMSIGENNGTEDFVWNTYGKAMHDYALSNPTRKLSFVHRLHYAGFPEMLTKFSPLRSLPNFDFDVSIKISQAHIYTTTTPGWFSAELADVKSNNLKTYLEFRNDDVYYLTWGDPDFARSYLKNTLTRLGDTFKGFYMGSDGYNPTRTFFSRNSVTQGMLEVKRQPYMFMLWGRLSYNPNTSDEVFKNYLARKYSLASSDNLFKAWLNGSKGFQLMSELVTGTWDFDFHWWPEAGISGRTPGKGFRTIDDLGTVSVVPGSSFCGIAASASNSCGSKKTAYQVADSIANSSTRALASLAGMSASPNSELGITLNNVKAYCYWIPYITLMDAMFTGMDMQRTNNFSGGWRSLDSLVLAEYTHNGGTGKPSCENIPNRLEPAGSGKPSLKIQAITNRAVYCSMPSKSAYKLKIYSLEGRKAFEISGYGTESGTSTISFGSFPTHHPGHWIRFEAQRRPSEARVCMGGSNSFLLRPGPRTFP